MCFMDRQGINISSNKSQKYCKGKKKKKKKKEKKRR